jgi:hypothetical protein
MTCKEFLASLQMLQLAGAELGPESEVVVHQVKGLTHRWGTVSSIRIEHGKLILQYRNRK